MNFGTRILTTLTKPMSLKRLAKALGLFSSDYPMLEKELNALRDSGAVECNGGAWSVGQTPQRWPKAKELTPKILAALADGPKTRAEICDRIRQKDHSVDSRLGALKGSGKIRYKDGVYSLPSATVADELDVRVPEPDRIMSEAASAPIPLSDNVKIVPLEPAPKFTETPRPLADVSVPAKFDKPAVRNLYIYAQANGFEVGEMDVAPTHVFNRFEDMVSHLREVYFGA